MHNRFGIRPNGSPKIQVKTTEDVNISLHKLLITFLFHYQKLISSMATTRVEPLTRSNNPSGFFHLSQYIHEKCQSDVTSDVLVSTAV